MESWGEADASWHLGDVPHLSPSPPVPLPSFAQVPGTKAREGVFRILWVLANALAL